MSDEILNFSSVLYIQKETHIGAKAPAPIMPFNRWRHNNHHPPRRRRKEAPYDS